MYARIIFLAYALGWLLLIAACGDDENDCGEKWGGPYPKDGTPIAQEKIDDFGRYQARGFMFSEATELESIEQLKKSVYQTAPHGVTGQLYNYVISTKCEIIVAEWTNDEAKWQNNKFEQALTEDKCPGGKDFMPDPSPGTLINFFPEDLGKQFREVDKRDRRSPCWQKGEELVDGADDAREDGLLDALSKHFMLAQGTGTTIEQFNGDTWPEAKIAYAGEVFVDLTSCTYSLNAGSGTYKPFEEHLVSVTRFFAKKVSDNSLKISGIKPWC